MTRTRPGWLRGVLLGVALPTAVLLLLAGPASASSAPTATAGSGGLIVQTAQGAVRGSESGAVRTFQGIPYAAPAQRWQPPQPPVNWSGTRDATAPGPECVQSAVFWRPGSTASHTEDCLVLNVWTPAHVDQQLPVLVWFHGGGWVNGAGTDVMPSRLTAQGNVVVTVNYRLGAEGYLALPALDAVAADGDSSGQYGDKDKVQALRWVRQNITAFGGDSHDVTIAGQSAGAGSVCWLMASPRAAGLFDRAIVESIGDCRELSHEQATTNGAAFARAIGCTDTNTQLACLRSKSPAQIIDAQAVSAVSWKPVVGGTAQPVPVTQAFAIGRFNRVPVIMGNNRHESRAFVYEANDLVRQPLTEAAYEAQTRATYGAQGDAVLTEYPASDYNSPGLASAAVATDANFACPSIGVEDSLSKWVSTYTYEFRDETAPLRPYMVVPPSFNTGSMHTAEVPYVWQSTTMSPLTDAQLKLADVMTSYWAHFALTGTPNTDGLAAWPRYTLPDRQRTTFLTGGATGVASGAAYSHEHHCGFWSSLT